MPKTGPMISIEGGVAAGKSATAKLIAQQTGWRFLTENFERHPFLEQFYTDPVKYGLETELAFLAIHFQQLKEYHRARPLVTDFSLGNDFSFCQMLLSGKDLDLLKHVCSELISRVGTPDLTIYLDVPPALMLQRVTRRARPYEQDITEDYLAGLRDKYLASRAKLGNQFVTLPVAARDNTAVVARQAMAIITKTFPDLVPA